MNDMAGTVEKVLDRTGREEGVTTGSFKRCNLEGCKGLRVMVRWPDGKWTWPCTAGMKWNNEANAYQII
jgi:hypothetical protein